MSSELSFCGLLKVKRDPAADVPETKVECPEVRKNETHGI